MNVAARTSIVNQRDSVASVVQVYFQSTRRGRFIEFRRRHVRRVSVASERRRGIASLELANKTAADAKSAVLLGECL